MRIRPLRLFFVVVLLHVLAVSPYAEKKQEEPPLNKIKIGACDSPGGVKRLMEKEEKKGLVIDARPFAINQSTGKLTFEGQKGRVTVAHMNPFLYQYNISVTQAELTTSAVTDFLDILLPPGLRIGKNAQAAEKSDRKAISTLMEKTSSSGPVATRLGNFDPDDCPTSDVCEALTTMSDEFSEIEKQLSHASLDSTIAPPSEYGTFKTDLNTLRDEQADASTTCSNAQTLHSHLNTFIAGTYLDNLDSARKSIKSIRLLSNDLYALADKFLEDKDFKKLRAVRCDGFNCAGEFKAYAEAVNGLLDLYDHELDDFIAVGEFMKKMQGLTDPATAKEGLFARTFEIIKKTEASEATVSIARTKIETKAEPAKQEADDGNNNDESLNHARLGHAASNDDAAPKEDGDDDKEKDDKAAKGAKGNAVTPDINESIQIGRPRFLLSGGLVFSPLRRETFDNVKGFVRDANGNATGDGNKSVVGLSENSPRRLLPMVMLNTRLTSFEPTSLYFSLGVTAKHDDNIDVEYLLGPSFSLLNERALFTFGGYVGKVQQLVPDVKIGDEIPDEAGDAKLFTKRYSWKPGFSFTYVFSQNQRGESVNTGGSGGGSGGSGDIKNEIRIGGVPFNLAMGLAYTSLEERTYDEIVGYARDRDGKLTNGQNLTRIVGLTSSSGYRLAPLALLHARLFDFGDRSFYFSTGVTGKKSDDKLQIEYLLGGTVNAYRRKLFVTFGAFAGKQSVLGGDFFLGAKLDKDQNVTTTTRYVWKPGFAISYDITKILKRDSQ